MEQKWYRKNVVKSIWILAEHVFLLVMAASFLWLMSYPVLRSEIFNGTHADQYEDTKAFADQVLHTGEGISAGIAQKEDFETDGYYDPDKEALRQKFGRVDGSMDKDTYAPGSYIKGSFRDGRYQKTKPVSKVQKIVGMVGLAIFFVVLVLIARYFSLLW